MAVMGSEPAREEGGREMAAGKKQDDGAREAESRPLASIAAAAAAAFS